MQIWKSTQIGATFRATGDGYEVWLGSQSGGSLRLSRNETNQLFSEASDIEAASVGSTSEAQSLAKKVWQLDRALRFALILLDPSEPWDDIQKIADLLEKLLAEPPAATYCLEQLCATALPAGNRSSELALQTSWTRIAALAKELCALQPAITDVRSRFDAIPNDLLPAKERRVFFEAALEKGVLLRLARGWQSEAERQFALLSAQSALRGAATNAHEVLKQWIVHTPRRGYRIAAHEEIHEDDRALAYGRGQPIRSNPLENVFAQQRTIRNLLQVGSLDRARRYADELVEQQMPEGTEFVAKTLCNIAQEAKRFGITHLHHEWSYRAAEIRPEDAWAQGQKADALVTLGRFDEARSALALAQSEYPAFVANNLARVKRRMGDLDGALEAYEAARRDFQGDPDEHRSWAGLAEVHRDLGSFDLALRLYTEAAEKFPLESAIASGRAAVLVDMGRFSDALASLSKALASSKGNVVALNGIATVYREQGDLEAALSKYDEILDLYPNEPAIQCGRAEVLRLMGRMQEALESYDISIESFPYIDVAYVGKGRVLIQTGRFQAAESFLREAAERFPNNNHISLTSAYLSARRGDWHEAIATYDRVIRNNAQNLKVRLEKARAFNRMGAPTLAISEIDGILELAPSHLQAKSEMAGSLFLLGEYEKALSYLEAIRNPKNHSEWSSEFVRAVILDKVNNSHDSVEIFQAGMKSKIPRVRRLMSSALAVFKLRDNRISDARNIIESEVGEASDVVKLHIAAASREPNIAGRVRDIGYELPALQREIRTEIVRRFRIIEGSDKAQYSRAWLFEEEMKLLLFDATSDDYRVAA